MSDYTALREVTGRLIARLNDALQADPLLSSNAASPRTPAEMATSSPQQMGLSVWLYQVDRNEYLLNQAPVRVDVDLVQLAPMPLNLHYLMTPIATSVETEQLMLGKVVQLLHDRPMFLPDPSNPELQDELRTTLENPGMEVLSRIWDALQQPYRLCASYLVQVVNIDSGEQPERVLPVLEQLTDYSQVVSAP
jgi:hypothetical protein